VHVLCTGVWSNKACTLLNYLSAVKLGEGIWWWLTRLLLQALVLVLVQFSDPSPRKHHKIDFAALVLFHKGPTTMYNVAQLDGLGTWWCFCSRRDNCKCQPFCWSSNGDMLEVRRVHLYVISLAIWRQWGVNSCSTLGRINIRTHAIQACDVCDNCFLIFWGKANCRIGCLAWRDPAGTGSVRHIIGSPGFLFGDFWVKH